MADKMLKSAARSVCKYSRTSPQGLTLVHYSAQRKHVLWDTMGLWAELVTLNGSVRLSTEMDECKPPCLPVRHPQDPRDGHHLREEQQHPGGALVRGPHRYCSPRHRMPFN